MDLSILVLSKLTHSCDILGHTFRTFFLGIKYNCIGRDIFNIDANRLNDRFNICLPWQSSACVLGMATLAEQGKYKLALPVLGWLGMVPGQ